MRVLVKLLIMNNGLDDLDRAILAELQADARVSNLELARRVHLSPPATHARVRQLEEEGYIQGYFTKIHRQHVGYNMLCFVSVSLQRHQEDQVAGFHAAIEGMPEVLECCHVTGEYDFLLRVVARNTEDLESFLLHRLTPIPGVSRIHTSLVLREVKSSTFIPLK
jgi:Lrp/AsnC family leucine-responsive transcriptional regulator